MGMLRLKIEIEPPKICENFLGVGAIDMYNRQLKDSGGFYDISHPRHDPFPYPGLHVYLAEESVLTALGVPVNYTQMSLAVYEDFGNSLDIISSGLIDAVGYLLDSGIKVAMVYGDRDYACNWIDGEKASLAVPCSRFVSVCQGWIFSLGHP